MKAENNLKMMCYYIRHQDCISRTVQVQNINANAICNLCHLREEGNKYKSPEEAPKIGKDWGRNMETIQEWIRQYIGVTGVSLAYVIREKVEVEPEDQDQLTDYDSVREEMIA